MNVSREQKKNNKKPFILYVSLKIDYLPVQF